MRDDRRRAATLHHVQLGRSAPVGRSYAGGSLVRGKWGRAPAGVCTVGVRGERRLRGGRGRRSVWARGVGGRGVGELAGAAAHSGGGPRSDAARRLRRGEGRPVGSVPRAPSSIAACPTTAPRSVAARRVLARLDTPWLAPPALRTQRGGAGRRARGARGGAAAPRRADGLPPRPQRDVQRIAATATAAAATAAAAAAARATARFAKRLMRARPLRSRARGRVVPHLRGRGREVGGEAWERERKKQRGDAGAGERMCGDRAGVGTKVRGVKGVEVKGAGSGLGSRGHRSKGKVYASARLRWRASRHLLAGRV